MTCVLRSTNSSPGAAKLYTGNAAFFSSPIDERNSAKELGKPGKPGNIAPQFFLDPNLTVPSLDPTMLSLVGNRTFRRTSG